MRKYLPILLILFTLPVFGATVTTTTDWTVRSNSQQIDTLVVTIDSGSNRKFIIYHMDRANTYTEGTITVGGQSPTETISADLVQAGTTYRHRLWIWKESAIVAMSGTTVSWSDGTTNDISHLYGTIENTDQANLSSFTGTDIGNTDLTVTTTSSSGDLIACAAIEEDETTSFTGWDTLTEELDAQPTGDITRHGYGVGNGGDNTTVIDILAPSNNSASCIVFADFTGPTFTAGPTLNACTATTCTFDFTSDTTGTVFSAAYTTGASAPGDCNAVETGTGAESTASEAVTATVADSDTLTSTLIQHDYYFCIEEAPDTDSAVSSVLNQNRNAPTGFSIVVNAGMSGTAPFAQPVDTACDTDGSTAVLTGCADTADMGPGAICTVSAGLPNTGPFKIVAKTVSTLTIDTVTNSVQSNVTVTCLVDTSGNPFFNPGIADNDLFELPADTNICTACLTWDTALDVVYTPDAGEEEDFASITSCMQDVSDSTGEFTRPDCWSGAAFLIYVNNVAPSFDIASVADISLPVGSAMDAIDFDALCTHANLTPATELRSGSSLPASLSFSSGTVSGTVDAENESGFSVDFWCEAGGLYGLQTWTAYPVTTWTMVDITGDTVDAGIVTIEAAAPWRVGDGITSTISCDDSVARGDIISQSPAASTEVVAEVAISAVPSTGPTCSRQRRRTP